MKLEKWPLGAKRLRTTALDLSENNLENTPLFCIQCINLCAHKLKTKFFRRYKNFDLSHTSTEITARGIGEVESTSPTRKWRYSIPHFIILSTFKNRISVTFLRHSFPFNQLNSPEVDSVLSWLWCLLFHIYKHRTYWWSFFGVQVSMFPYAEILSPFQTCQWS